MKTQKLLLSLLILTILIQTNSCKKTSIVALYNTEFPNNIGTNWKYKVYDSINSILDTITIKIIGTTNLDNGDAASIWSINSLLNGTDTNYVTNKSDGIRIYPDKLLTASPTKKYLFPLDVGNYWITQNILDTNRVTQKNSISILAGNFPEAYRINRNTRIPPGLNVIKEDEWFVQNVGMVSRYYFSYDVTGIVNKKWELVSYQIK